MLCDSFQRALDNLRGQKVIAVQLQQTQELGSLTSEVASPRSPLLATPGMLTAAAEADSCAALPVLEAAIAASTAWKWDTARPATVSRKSPSWSTLRACEVRQAAAHLAAPAQKDATPQLKRQSLVNSQEPQSQAGDACSMCVQGTLKGMQDTMLCATTERALTWRRWLSRRGQPGNPLGMQAQLGSLAQQHWLQLYVQQAHAGGLPGRGPCHISRCGSLRCQCAPPREQTPPLAGPRTSPCPRCSPVQQRADLLLHRFKGKLLHSHTSLTAPHACNH